MKKKIVSLMLCLVMCASVLAGCGSSNTKESSTQTSSAAESKSEVKESSTVESTEPVEEEVDYAGTTFRIAWWGGDERNTNTVAIIENFEKQYKNLKVEVEYSANSDYWTRIQTQTAAGDLPDVWMMDYAYIGTYVDAGVLEPLDSYIESGAIDFTNVDVSSNAGAVVGGVTYGVVTGVNSPCILYDAEILAEAGATLSYAPTLSELGEAARTVYEATGKQVYVLDPMNVQFEKYLMSIGMNKFNDERTDFACTPEVVTEYITFWAAGLEEGWVITDIEYSGDQGTCMRDENPCWLEYSGNGMTNLVKGFSEGADKLLSVCGHPRADGSDVNGNYLKPTMLWSVYSESENKELACEFINYFVNDTYVYDVCGIDRGMPISSEVRDHVTPSFDEYNVVAKEYIDVLSGDSSPIPEANSLKTGDAWNCVKDVWDMIRYDEITMDEIAEAVEAGFEEGREELAKAIAER